MKCKKCLKDCSKHYHNVGKEIYLCPDCYEIYHKGQELIPVTENDYENYRANFVK